jgi:hypothetical protein
VANGWSCNWEDYTYAYRERIALSDGTIRCCESNILIPAGFPYADCRPAWWYDTEPPCEDPDELPNGELLPLLEPHPQCIEVWRHIRNDSAKRGSCPSWGFAVDEYHEAHSRTGEQAELLEYLRLVGKIKATSERYAKGLPPRLHPHERQSLESGQFVDALPFSLRKQEVKHG